MQTGPEYWTEFCQLLPRVYWVWKKTLNTTLPEARAHYLLLNQYSGFPGPIHVKCLYWCFYLYVLLKQVYSWNEILHELFCCTNNTKRRLSCSKVRIQSIYNEYSWWGVRLIVLMIRLDPESLIGQILSAVRIKLVNVFSLSDSLFSVPQRKSEQCSGWTLGWSAGHTGQPSAGWAGIRHSASSWSGWGE